MRPILTASSSVAGRINQEHGCITLNLCEGIVPYIPRLGQWLNKMNLPFREGVFAPLYGFPLTMMLMEDRMQRSHWYARVWAMASSIGYYGTEPSFKDLETAITGGLIELSQGVISELI